MGSGSWVLILIVVVGIIVAIAIYASLPPKCPKCGNREGNWKVDGPVLGTRRTTRTEVVEEVKNSKGEVIRTREAKIPVLETTYEVHNYCEKCGHQWNTSRTDRTDL